MTESQPDDEWNANEVFTPTVDEIRQQCEAIRSGQIRVSDSSWEKWAEWRAGMELSCPKSDLKNLVK